MQNNFLKIFRNLIFVIFLVTPNYIIAQCNSPLPSGYGSYFYMGYGQSIEQINDSTITLHWDNPNNILTGDDVIGYKITIKEDTENSFPSIWLDENIHVDTLNFTFNNLIPQTKYIVKMKSICESSLSEAGYEAFYTYPDSQINISPNYGLLGQEFNVNIHDIYNINFYNPNWDIYAYNIKLTNYSDVLFFDFDTIYGNNFNATLELPLNAQQGFWDLQVFDNPKGCWITNPNAIYFDGPEGCTDENAQNYNSYSSTDDGSCIYCDISFINTLVQDNSTNSLCDGYVVTDALSSYSPINYSWSNNQTESFNLNLCTGMYYVTATDDIGCSVTDSFMIGEFIYGCTDNLASNYNESANADDGSCYYCDVSITTNALQIPTPGLCNGLIIVNTNSSYSSTSLSWSNGSTSNVISNLCEGVYELNVTDSLGCIITETFSLGNIVYGCTDSQAINYNPEATIDDNSCELSAVEYSTQWQAFGPTQVPLQNNGAKRGIGRVSNITLNSQNDSVIWVSTPSGGLWKSEDNGNSWSTNTDFLPNLGVSDVVIDPNNSNIMYFISGDRDKGDTYAYGLMKSTDGGESWNLTGLTFDIESAYRGNRILIDPNNSNILLVSTRKSSYGETYRSIDGGENFEMVLQGPNFISMEYNVSNPNTVYAVTTGTSKFYRSNDNGLTWDNMTNDVGLPNSGNNRGIIGVTEANSNVVYILYSSNDDGFGGLYKSIDGGYNFTLQSETPNILSWETDGIGYGGQGTYDLALAVSPENENIVFVGGVNIWKSTNSGLSWDISSHWYGGGGVEYVHADQYIIKFNSTGNVLYSGNGGGIYQSNDLGNSWNDISDGLQITQFYKIGISQSNYGLLLGGTKDNGTLRANSQIDWDAVRGGDGMECAVDPTNPDIMYSELYYGDIAISTNGGGNWDNIAPDSDGTWITPYQIDQNNPNRIVIGYNYIYESLDYGSSWDTISSNFSGNIDVICLSPSNDDVIYIAEDEDIFKTTDGGDNWNNISGGLPSKTITSIAVHPDNSNELWTTFSGYSDGDKVFYSTDGGDNWSNVSDNLPNLPSNTILFYPPNETLFLGTDIGVFYKDSSMTEWENFNQGLPNVIVTELEYHINSNKLFASTYGRGVWVSDLPATAPPIASFNYSIIDECSGLVDFNNTSSNAHSIEWFFDDDYSSTENNISHQYTADGNYEVILVVTNDLGTDTISQILTINVLDMPTALSFDIVDCGVDSYDLSIFDNTDYEICWLEDSINESILHIGNTYTISDNNLQNSLYYSYFDTISYGNVGPSVHEGSNEYSGSLNSVGSLVFNAYETFILESVDVFTNQEGERKIVLLDSNGLVLQEHTENVPTSNNTPHTIVLNFKINPGTNYKITTDDGVSIANFGGTNPQFKRTSNAVPLSFPYNYDNTLSITSSYWGDEILTDYYYYFYNWKILNVCISPKSEIVLNVDTLTVLACGCMDATALNYNPEATNDDNSCVYDFCIVNVLQDDECNNNGVLEIIPSADFSSPYNLEVGLPNGSLFTTEFTEDTFLLTGLDGSNGGTYYVTITSGAKTCSEQETISETVFNSSNFSPSISFNGYNVSCYGSCDGAIQVNIFPTPETYTIEFYQDSVAGLPFYSIASNNAIQTGLCAGEYFILFTSSTTGCEIVRPHTLREPDSIHVDKTITNVLCNSQFDGDIQIDVSGGVGLKINNSTGNVIDTLDYSFSWTGPNGFTSTVEDIYYLEAGEYNLEIIDNNNCVYEDVYTVLPLPLNDIGNCDDNNIDYHNTCDPFVWVTENTTYTDYVVGDTVINNFPICYYFYTEGGYYQQNNFISEILTQFDSVVVYELIQDCSFTDPCDFTPIGLYIDNIIHDRISFNWLMPQLIPSHYMIRYRVVGTNNWTVITAGPQTPSPFYGTSRTRYFMEPETTYEWNIRARVLNEDGSINCQSDWSETSTYTTLPACANLDNLSVSTEATWVTFFADAPDESWGVWQSKGKIREAGLNNYRYVNGDNIGNINGLKGNFTANTDYEWHTKAWCTGNIDVNGNSDPQYHSGWGEFSAFTTEELCDKLPINLSTATNGANTAVIMSWDSPQSGNPDHYFLEMTNNTSGAVYQWNNIPGTSNSKTKFNQSPGDEISWRIRGACGTNGTSWATIFTQPTVYTLGGEKLQSLSLNSLEIYPNPSRDVFNIELSTEYTQQIEIRVVNSIGQEIYRERVEVENMYAEQIDLSNYSKGIYNLTIKTSDGISNHKLILQ